MAIRPFVAPAWTDSGESYNSFTGQVDSLTIEAPVALFTLFSADPLLHSLGKSY